jgi:hypothetical protein
LRNLFDVLLRDVQPIVVLRVFGERCQVRFNNAVVRWGSKSQISTRSSERDTNVTQGAVHGAVRVTQR